MDSFNLDNTVDHKGFFNDSTLSNNIDEDFDIKLAEFSEHQLRGQEIGIIMDKTYKLFYK